MIFKCKKSEKFGFTLVELLIVMAIIGMLAVFTLAYLRSSLSKARDAKRVADINQIGKGISIYLDSCHEYPDSLTLTTNNGCSGTDNLQRFLPVIPVPPPGPDLVYMYAGLTDGVGSECTAYHIGITLEKTDHDALTSDSDAAAGIACGSGVDFSSTPADAIYDIKIGAF